MLCEDTIMRRFIALLALLCAFFGVDPVWADNKPTAAEAAAQVLAPAETTSRAAPAASTPAESKPADSKPAAGKPADSKPKDGKAPAKAPK
jgi:hypothetical protein